MRRWLHHRSRVPKPLRALVAVLLGAAALTMWTHPQAATAGANTPSSPPAVATKLPNPPGPGAQTLKIPTSKALVAEGQQLFDEHCASCHGLSLQGQKGLAPALRDIGAGPVDFYLSTGRMPLANNRAEPFREAPVFTKRQIDAIIDYVLKAGGGPPAPTADPAKGNLGQGFQLFTQNCAGCHSIVARGGITVGALVPDLQQATPTEIAEAVRMGPYLMPRFSSSQLDQQDLNSIARYVLYTRAPDNAGGWGIYNIGPIPEGIVAWFVGLLALVIVARLIGEREA
ncbi:MAG TPA: c-type cytochrome [Solirubrobacteraceae bacterium]|nr:c-type cytochrome [Solirubrobacteraceae bacterium]